MLHLHSWSSIIQIFLSVEKVDTVGSNTHDGQPQQKRKPTHDQTWANRTRRPTITVQWLPHNDHQPARTTHPHPTAHHPAPPPSQPSPILDRTIHGIATEQLPFQRTSPSVSSVKCSYCATSLRDLCLCSPLNIGQAGNAASRKSVFEAAERHYSRPYLSSLAFSTFRCLFLQP